jgi:hypothetical protein
LRKRSLVTTAWLVAAPLVEVVPLVVEALGVVEVESSLVAASAAAVPVMENVAALVAAWALVAALHVAACQQEALSVVSPYMRCMGWCRYTGSCPMLL